jgi:predicted outer membrane repeat protein
MGQRKIRVVIPDGIRLLSVNGPTNSFLVGGSLTRCANVGSNALLSGFTLANGHPGYSGNCVLSGYLGVNGGGASGTTLYNSLLIGNGAIHGGGAYDSLLINCTVSRNTATTSGGGFYSSFGLPANNSILFSNPAPAAVPRGTGGCNTDSPDTPKMVAEKESALILAFSRLGRVIGEEESPIGVISQFLPTASMRTTDSLILTIMDPVRIRPQKIGKIELNALNDWIERVNDSVRRLHGVFGEQVED